MVAPQGTNLAYKNVLQELILALLGRPGDVFIDAEKGSNEGRHKKSSKAIVIREPQTCTFMLAEDLSWIGESDRLALNSIVSLGYHYGELQHWVRWERSPTHQGNSAYCRAIAGGIEEVLEVYSSAVLRLEQDILSDGCPTLSALQHFSMEFHVLLGPLHHMVHRIMDKNIHGKQLISELQKKANCGIPSLASSMEHLLWHANQVLFQQLSAWMVHGLLQDPHGEFFIQRVTTMSETPKQPGKLPDCQLSDPDDGLIKEWHDGFQVCIDKTPTGISVPVAADILFVGKAIRVLRKPGAAFRRQQLLPAEDMLVVTEALARLQDEPDFNRLRFEKTVEQIRMRVAGRLWQLVVVEAELLLHLRALKDYFLLARGDFWQCFISESSKLMSLPPRATSDADINVPFQQSALKSTAVDDKLFSNLSIRISQPGSDAEAHNPADFVGSASMVVPMYDKNNWDYLSLGFKVIWPLGILLTPAVLSTYNTLFRYLLRLKRVESKLHEAWSQLQMASWKHNYERLPVWQLRQLMSYVFTNIEMYYQMDVIEVQHAQLNRSISNAQDFKEVQRAHDAFLSALLDQSFLDMPTFTSALEQMMDMARTLCSWIYGDAVLGEEGHGCSEPSQIDKLSKSFKSKLSILYKTLERSKGRRQSQAPAVRQLLVRLDFNYFMA